MAEIPPQAIPVSLPEEQSDLHEFPYHLFQEERIARRAVEKDASEVTQGRVVAKDPG
jgi:hypothetical protein